MTSPGGRLRRAIRRFTLGSGPLKRRSDRVQLVARVLVVLAFVAAPPAAVVVAAVTTGDLEAVAATQAADRHQTRAVVLQDAPAPDSRASDDVSLGAVPAQAGWTTPRGIARVGTALVRPGTRVGQTLTVWQDGDGNLTRPPRDRDDIPGSAMAVAAIPLLGLPLLAWTLYAAVCSVLEGHRDRRWTAEWAVVEPVWRRQLQ
jgi:hypothetical protein